MCNTSVIPEAFLYYFFIPALFICSIFPQFPFFQLSVFPGFSVSPLHGALLCGATVLYCGLSGVGVCLVNATAQQVRGHLADQGGVRESVSISLCTHTVNVCGCNAGSEKAHAGTRGVCNNTGGTPQDSTH